MSIFGEHLMPAIAAAGSLFASHSYGITERCDVPRLQGKLHGV